MTRHIGSTRKAALALALAAISAAAPAATITVTSTSDAVANDGFCTLREAINSANGNIASGGLMGECVAGQAFPTVDTIEFQIPAAGVQTITPTSALGPLTEAVVIDGYTQGDASPNTLAVGTDAKLRVEIDGSSLPSGTVLLYINTDGATIRGLVIDITAYNTWALWINGHDNNTIAGNYINTDATGNTFNGDTSKGNTPLIVVGNSNMIGGSSPGDRNVMAPAGFNTAIVAISGAGNTLQGNYVDVSADGTAALESATPGTAVDLFQRGPASATQIGGATPGAGNVIYGTVQAILVRGDSGTVIQGNYIGTDATGSYALGGGSYGISIIDSKDTMIGGAGAGNLISGYSDGILMYDSGNEPGTVIQGNQIGTDSTGTHAIANSGAGIHIGSPGVDLGLTSTQSTVGGTSPGEGNTIANNCVGIKFDNNAAFNRWPILGNSIYSNQGLGISLNFTGLPLQNDDGMLDADSGPNNLQNYPVITGTPMSNGSVSIYGTLDSAASTTFRLEFFSGIGCHASGYGEGRHFLGSTDVMTNVGGKVNFGPAMFSLPVGHSVFTATATDPDGNTSEFSQCYGTPDLLFSNGFEGGCSGSD